MTSAQDLAEKCQKKLQIAFFSATDDRMWWEFSNIDFIKSLYRGLLFTATWRKAAINVVSIGVGRIDDGIDEEHVAVIICQYVAIHGIEDVVLPIGVVFSIILRTEAKAQKLVMDFLFGCETSIGNKRLNEYSTDFAVSIFSKSYHAILTIWKVLVMRLDAFKERCKVVVSITEIVQFDNLPLVWRQIDFIL